MAVDGPHCFKLSSDNPLIQLIILFIFEKKAVLVRLIKELRSFWTTINKTGEDRRWRFKLNCRRPVVQLSERSNKRYILYIYTCICVYMYIYMSLLSKSVEWEGSGAGWTIFNAFLIRGTLLVYNGQNGRNCYIIFNVPVAKYAILLESFARVLLFYCSRTVREKFHSRKVDAIPLSSIGCNCTTWVEFFEDLFKCYENGGNELVEPVLSQRMVFSDIISSKV